MLASNRSIPQENGLHESMAIGDDPALRSFMLNREHTNTISSTLELKKLRYSRRWPGLMTNRLAVSLLYWISGSCVCANGMLFVRLKPKKWGK